MARQVVGLAWPMLVGMISIVAFNVADTWFVSQLGSLELAAMGYVFPVLMVVGAIALGIGVGTTSAIARALGARGGPNVQRIATHALLLGLGVVALFSTAGFFTIEPLFALLGAQGETLAAVTEYMRIWYLGIAFLVVPMVGNAAIRATGDTRTPAVIMAVAAGVNIAMDPLLIWGLGPIPAMGLAGAAIATVASRALTLLFSLWVLHTREHMIVWSLPRPAELLASWRAVLAVGIPEAANRLAVPFAMAVVTALAARFGDTAVAALGAGGRVEMVALILPIALSAGLVPFVGQNWGAGRRDRVAHALKLSLGFALAWGLVSWGILAGLARPIAALFTEDEAVLAGLTTYLRLVPAGYALLGAFQIVAGAFNAAGRPLRASALALLRAPVLLLAFVWAGGELWGLTGLFGGLVAANVVTGALSLLWSRSLGEMDSAGSAEPGGAPSGSEESAPITS